MVSSIFSKATKINNVRIVYFTIGSMPKSEQKSDQHKLF